MSNLLPTSTLPALRIERRNSAFRSRPRLFALLIGAIALASCGPGVEIRAAEPSSAAESASADAANDAVTTHIVEIKGFKFSPAILTVKSGDRIVWKNLDVTPHIATDEAGAWNSGNLNNGDAWSLIAGAPGESSYICAYHPAMQGKIIVVE